VKPFILEKHATEYLAIRELQQEERELAAGGCPSVPQLPTLSVNPETGPDNMDEA
jgi:hypothetical protein